MTLNTDEEYLHNNEAADRALPRPDRLTPGELANARRLRLREVLMWSIVREMLVYLCFVLLLSVIVYSHCDGNASLQSRHLRKYFLRANQTDQHHSQVCFP